MGSDKLLNGWFTTDAMDDFVYAHVQMQLIYSYFSHHTKLFVRSLYMLAASNDMTRRENVNDCGKRFPFWDGKPVTLFISPDV